MPEAFSSDGRSEHLKWLHIVVSKLEGFPLNGTCHGVGSKHLQAFFGEFCLRFNRQFWRDRLFGRTIAACAACEPLARKAIVMN